MTTGDAALKTFQHQKDITFILERCPVLPVAEQAFVSRIYGYCKLNIDDRQTLLQLYLKYSKLQKLKKYRLGYKNLRRRGRPQTRKKV